MTLEEAIEHCENIEACASCKAEHLQLAEWLKELKGYKEQSTVEPKRGKWLRMERCNMDGDITYSANCSVCSAEVCLWQHESYCPCCGARMGGDEE